MLDIVTWWKQIVRRWFEWEGLLGRWRGDQSIKLCVERYAAHGDWKGNQLASQSTSHSHARCWFLLSSIDVSASMFDFNLIGGRGEYIEKSNLVGLK